MSVSPTYTADADPLHADCPGREVFELITSRWVLLILWALKDGTQRFYHLRDRIEGISERMLSQNLKSLCRNGLIERYVEPTVPPKVSYALTPAGQDLLSIMDGLAGWIGRQLPAIEEARQRYDRMER
ncbi:winged helix-turn-helix transcriptional regulator [Nitratireductor thuwali]|uniref:HTH-type transcriptional activator HxlR n=1 Tax=Nitratireductor thuwali TaxID=2267699 RepID=A0ABY5MFB8_9HYPH|nr:HTH-type transcriptional activator HxlR [Nitratireductor thuwali]